MAVSCSGGSLGSDRRCLCHCVSFLVGVLDTVCVCSVVCEESLQTLHVQYPVLCSMCCMFWCAVPSNAVICGRRT